MIQHEFVSASVVYAEIDNLRSEIDDLEAAITEKRKRLKYLLGKIETPTLAATLQLPSSVNKPSIVKPFPQLEPRLTDHALMRFLERVLKIDLDEFRQRILTPAMTKAVNLGATTITIEGIRFRLVGPNIVTVLDKQVKKRLKSGKPRYQENEDD